MRSLWAAALLFLAVLICVTLNGIYLHRTAERLTAALDALPPTASGADAAPLRALWEACRLPVSLTVPAMRTNGIEEALLALEAAAEVGDEALYRQSCAALRRAIGKLHEAEGCALSGIL